VAVPASPVAATSSVPAKPPARDLYGLDDDDPRRTYVEFTLEPDSEGTVLTVVETGFAQMPDDAHHAAFDGNSRGWVRELGELVNYLAA